MAKTNLSNHVRLMSVHEKRAWYILAVFVVTGLCYVALLPVLGPKGARGAFGILGLMGLSPFIFRKKRERQEIEADERDTMILQKAGLAAGMASYCTFVLTAMGFWNVYYLFKGESMISVHSLPLVVLIGASIFFLVQSITTVILYRRS